MIAFVATARAVVSPSSFATYFVFQALLSGDTLRSPIGDPGVVRALIGVGTYLAVLGCSASVSAPSSTPAPTRSPPCSGWSSSPQILFSCYRKPGRQPSARMYRWKPAPRSSPSNHETGALETVVVD